MAVPCLNDFDLYSFCREVHLSNIKSQKSLEDQTTGKRETEEPPTPKATDVPPAPIAAAPANATGPYGFPDWDGYKKYVITQGHKEDCWCEQCTSARSFVWAH
ncbi:MAG: hypothetical protein EBT21_05435 [Actinobacteria bacterium]|nr:hypothetical protein [Actinomycetota bacterium]